MLRNPFQLPTVKSCTAIQYDRKLSDTLDGYSIGSNLKLTWIDSYKVNLLQRAVNVKMIDFSLVYLVANTRAEIYCCSSCQSDAPSILSWKFFYFSLLFNLVRQTIRKNMFSRTKTNFHSLLTTRNDRIQCLILLYEYGHAELFQEQYSHLKLLRIIKQHRVYGLRNHAFHLKLWKKEQRRGFVWWIKFNSRILYVKLAKIYVRFFSQCDFIANFQNNKNKRDDDRLGIRKYIIQSKFIYCGLLVECVFLSIEISSNAWHLSATGMSRLHFAQSNMSNSSLGNGS